MIAAVSGSVVLCGIAWERPEVGRRAEASQAATALRRYSALGSSGASAVGRGVRFGL